MRKNRRKKKNIIVLFREYIAKKNKFITNILYVLFEIILLINLAMFDWLGESLICSIFFTKIEKTMPIIDIRVEEYIHYVKHKEINVEKFYIITETNEIEVLPRKNYKKGENITYYVYRLGNIEQASVQNFDLIKSIIGVFIFIVDTIIAINFIFVDNEKKKEKPKVRPKRELPKKWNEFSKKELLILCENWELKIPKHKKNDVNYIKTMLRNNEYKIDKKPKKTTLFDIVLITLYVIAMIWILSYYIEIAKYFIMLTL